MMKKACTTLLRAARDVAREGESSACSLRRFAGTTDFAHSGGNPLGTYKRKVIISSPSRFVGQSGKSATVYGQRATWKIDFDQQSNWENPLMGWTSTADPQEGLRVENGMSFYTKEQAIAFCTKYGWEYEVREPKGGRTNASVHYRNPRFYQYGDNFSVKRGGLPVGGLRSEYEAASKAVSKTGGKK